MQGYRFCDLLLGRGRHPDVRQRASQALEREEGRLLDIALDNLSLGRAALIEALHPERIEGALASSAQRRAAFEEAARYLDQAVQRLRAAGQQQELPRGLLARAELRRAMRSFTDAWRDLEEAREIAERGEMRLFLADFHLEAARLSHAEGKTDQAREHLAAAKQMVEQMGYGRRKPEVEELEKQLDASSAS